MTILESSILKAQEVWHIAGVWLDSQSSLDTNLPLDLPLST
jgi:hypothetical protein